MLERHTYLEPQGYIADLSQGTHLEMKCNNSELYHVYVYHV